MDQGLQRQAIAADSSQLAKDDDLRRLFIIIDTALATLVGMIEDHVLQNGFMAIEGYDMIDWLRKHGCQTGSRDHSGHVRRLFRL